MKNHLSRKQVTLALTLITLALGITGCGNQKPELTATQKDQYFSTLENWQKSMKMVMVSHPKSTDIQGRNRLNFFDLLEHRTAKAKLDESLQNGTCKYNEVALSQSQSYVVTGEGCPIESSLKLAPHEANLFFKVHDSDLKRSSDVHGFGLKITGHMTGLNGAQNAQKLELSGAIDTQKGGPIPVVGHVQAETSLASTQISAALELRFPDFSGELTLSTAIQNGAGNPVGNIETKMRLNDVELTKSEQERLFKIVLSFIQH